LLLPFFAATVILSAAGCAAPPADDGATRSANLSSTTAATDACGVGQTAIDFSLHYGDGAADAAHGCFTDGDDWFTNGRILNVDADLPAGSFHLQVRIFHRDQLTGAGLVFPGPAGDASVSYDVGQSAYFTSSAPRLEVSEIALPTGDSDPNGVLAGTVTAHIVSNIGDRDGDLRVVFAARGIKAGFI
jgi:hypothetical protein